VDEAHSIIFGVGIEHGNPGAITTGAGRVLNHHFLSYLTRGSGWYEDHTTPRRSINTGALVWILPGQWHVFDPGPQNQWCEYWMTFDGDAVRTRFGDLVPERSQIREIGPRHTILEPWRDLCDLWVFKQPGYLEYTLLLLHQILVEIFLDRRPFSQRKSDGVAARAEYCMRQDIEDGRPYTDVVELARTMGLSYESFRKRFREETGLPPSQYQVDLRIQRARSLLMNPNRTVKDIACTLGFDDPYYFSRVFKKRTGLSPDHYRRRHYPAGFDG
jgi:AraC-like DNA-binding protein